MHKELRASQTQTPPPPSSSPRQPRRAQKTPQPKLKSNFEKSVGRQFTNITGVALFHSHPRLGNQLTSLCNDNHHAQCSPTSCTRVGVSWAQMSERNSFVCGLGHPEPPHRGGHPCTVSCRDPRVCPHAQDGIRTERQPRWCASCHGYVKLLWRAPVLTSSCHVWQRASRPKDTRRRPASVEVARMKKPLLASATRARHEVLLPRYHAVPSGTTDQHRVIVGSPLVSCEALDCIALLLCALYLNLAVSSNCSLDDGVHVHAGRHFDNDPLHCCCGSLP